MALKKWLSTPTPQMRYSRPGGRLREAILLVMAVVGLAACGQAAPPPTATPTPVPTSTPTPLPTATPLVSETPLAEATAEATPELVEITTLAGEGMEPPFDIALPDEWGHVYDTLAIPDVDAALRAVQLSVYQGPVTGGTGTIVVMWGFPNIIASSPFILPGTPTPAPDLWSDGLRLFRTAMVERGCNAGTDLQRTYTVGGLTGSGTKFAIVDCPQTPDTRGWFVGVQEEGINFVFYVYTEPIEAMDVADGELQAILDSVNFHIAESFATD